MNGRQASTDSSGVSGMSKASATPGQVTWPASGVEAERQRRVVPAAPSCQPLSASAHGVRQRRVGERPGGGVGHGARHVRHAVEDRVVHREGRVGVRGRVACPRSSRPGRWRCRRAPSPASSARPCSLVTSLGALAPGISTAPITRSASSTCWRDARASRRRAAVHPVVVAPERHPQLVEVGVEDRHVGAHAERDVGGVLARRRRRRGRRPWRWRRRRRRPSARRGRPAACISACAPTCGARQPATSDIG